MLTALSATLVASASNAGQGDCTAEESAVAEYRVQQFARIQEVFNDGIWAMYLSASTRDVDLRGRSIADDLGAMKGAVDALRVRRDEVGRTLEGGCLAAYQLPDGNIEAVVVEQIQLLNNVARRWHTNLQISHNRGMWGRFLETNGVADPPPRDPDIERLEQQVRVELESEPPWSTPATARALLRAYADERNALARTLSHERVPDDDALTFRRRKTPCVPLTEVGEDHPVPRLADGGQPAYPPESHRLGEEGSMTLRIRVGVGGCAEATAVFISSGSALLDESALDWMEEARFHPARRGGEAFEAMMDLAVTFRVRETEP